MGRSTKELDRLLRMHSRARDQEEGLLSGRALASVPLSQLLASTAPSAQSLYRIHRSSTVRFTVMRPPAVEGSNCRLPSTLKMFDGRLLGCRAAPVRDPNPMYVWGTTTCPIYGPFYGTARCTRSQL